MNNKKKQPHGRDGDATNEPVDSAFREFFRVFAARTASAVGSPMAFVAATLIIIVWAVLGPVFHFSDTWQLVINTGTTIITFLIVFLIQHTQNRDARTIQLKLDELLLTSAAHRKMVDLEDCSDAELDELQANFKKIRERLHAYQK